MVEAGKIIAAHNPDKATGRVAHLKFCNGVYGIGAAPLALNVRDDFAGFMRYRIASSEAGIEGRCLARLQRILGADQPNHFVQPKCFLNATTNLNVTSMRGVEAATIEADPHAWE